MGKLGGWIDTLFNFIGGVSLVYVILSLSLIIIIISSLLYLYGYELYIITLPTLATHTFLSFYTIVNAYEISNFSDFKVICFFLIFIINGFIFLVIEDKNKSYSIYFDIIAILFTLFILLVYSCANVNLYLLDLDTVLKLFSFLSHFIPLKLLYSCFLYGNVKLGITYLYSYILIWVILNMDDKNNRHD